MLQIHSRMLLVCSLSFPVLGCNAAPSLTLTEHVRLQPGDKILKCSASFGNDIWDAQNYGQVVYAIKTRNGEVYLQLLDNGGDTSVMQVSFCMSYTCHVMSCHVMSYTEDMLNSDMHGMYPSF